MVTLFWGGTPPLSLVRATNYNFLGRRRKVTSNYPTKYACHTCIQVGGVDPSHFYPTGTNAENTGRDYSTITCSASCTPGRDSKTKPGRDCFLLYFITPTGTILVREYMDPDRDYPRSMKLHPTGTILVRENSPDRVSFVCFPTHFHLPPRGRHHSYHA